MFVYQSAGFSEFSLHCTAVTHGGPGKYGMNYGMFYEIMIAESVAGGCTARGPVVCRLNWKHMCNSFW